MTNSSSRVRLKRITRSTIAIWGALVLAGFASHVGRGRRAWAQTSKLAASGPSNSAPRNLLSPNFPDTADALREQAAELFQRVYDRQDQAADSAGVGTYEEIYVDLLRLGWLGTRLETQNEQLGVDISNRVNRLDRWVKSEIIAAAAKPELKNDVTKRVVSLERAHELADKKLSRRINDLFEKGNYIDAYEAYIEVTAPVEAQGLWYETVKSNKHPLLEKWSGTRRKHLLAAERQSKELAGQSRLALYKKFNIDPQSLIGQISSAAKGLATAPQTPLADGRMVSGPEALDHFFQAWVELQNKAVRAGAYRQIARYGGDAAPPSFDAKTYAQACDKIVAGLAGLIEADAERTSGDEAADLFNAYLDGLPMLLSRCSSSAAPQAFDGPLQKLAAKSPPLNERVEACRARTDELLRWRRRAAAAYLRSVSKEFAAPAPLATLAKLRQPMPDMIAAVSDKYLDKQVSAKGFLAIDPGNALAQSKYAVSDISDRLVFFATIPHDHLSAVVEAFRIETLAADVPPPTLGMRLALYRLERGDFQTAGGTITRAGFIGVPARFLSSQGDNRGLIRLGPLQRDEADVKIDDVMLQLMLDPAWISDTYWYAPLPAK